MSLQLLKLVRNQRQLGSLGVDCAKCFSQKLDKFIERNILRPRRALKPEPVSVSSENKPCFVKLDLRAPVILPNVTRKSLSVVDHLKQLLAQEQNHYALQLFLLCPEEFRNLSAPALFFDLANRAVVQQDVDALERIGAVFEAALPKEYEKSGKLELHHAEISWWKNDYPSALKKLSVTYKNYPSVRRKTRNYFSFLLHHGIANESVDPDIVLKQVQGFAQQIAETYNDYQPLVSIWKHGILCDNFKWQQAAENILKTYQNDKSALRMFTVRMRKILNDLNAETRREKSVALIQKLVEITLQLKYKELQSAAFNVLLRSQCERTWVKEAAETIKTAQLLTIRLEPELVQEHARQIHEERPVSPSLNVAKPIKSFSLKLRF